MAALAEVGQPAVLDVSGLHRYPKEGRPCPPRGLVESAAQRPRMASSASGDRRAQLGLACLVAVHHGVAELVRLAVDVVEERLALGRLGDLVRDDEADGDTGDQEQDAAHGLPSVPAGTQLDARSLACRRAGRGWRPGLRRRSPRS